MTHFEDQAIYSKKKRIFNLLFTCSILLKLRTQESSAIQSAKTHLLEITSNSCWVFLISIVIGVVHGSYTETHEMDSNEITAESVSHAPELV